MRDTIKSTKLTLALFIVYLIALFWIIVLKLNVELSNIKTSTNTNLIPYSRPLMLNGKADFGEPLLNILIFMPFGLYAGVLFKKWSFGKKVLLFFLTSLLLESLQFIFRVGTFDITDLINNTLGGAIGVLIYLGIEKNSHDPDKVRKLINLITLTGTVLLMSLIFFLKINRLWMFRM